MILLISGDRNWYKRDEMKSIIEFINQDNAIDIIVEGGCRGADNMAKFIAEELGIHVAEVNALWNFYHKSAGPIRNRAMLTLKPDLVIAFHEHIEESNGTADMLLSAEKAEIPYCLVE